MAASAATAGSGPTGLGYGDDMTRDDGRDTIFDDLAAEYARLDAVLAALPTQAWDEHSAATGWSVTDVVTHLAQSEELVSASVAGDGDGFGLDGAVSMDELVDGLVAADRG